MPSQRVREGDDPVSKAKIALGAAAALALVLLWWSLSETGMLSSFEDEQALRELVEGLGSWGPLIIIALMTAAIVMSPIPSGPIALVAGAAYGPVWGTVYIVVGAEAGAVIAFWIARCLGYEAVRRWWPAARSMLDRFGQNRSQTWLMAVVFGSRLVPFISFDAVSYAAGLTPLSFWRFGVATLAGVIPISFVLAYFGEELVTAELERLTPIILLLSAVTLVPIGLKLLWNRYKRRPGAGQALGYTPGSVPEEK